MYYYNKNKLRNRFADTLEPPPDLTIDEWADKYRILPRESSSEYGQWRTDRFPFTREIMRELSPQSGARQVTIQKGSQVACTELCINKQMYCIDYHPAPYLYIQKTLDAVEKYSKQRLQSSINACERMVGKIGAGKSRDSSNTILLKKFPGGVLILGGANSAASLRSVPIANLDLDEIDSYELNIQEEGDPIELAIRRTSNFARRKIFKLSTPKLTETSRIIPAFQGGDMRYYFIRCPFCGHAAPIMWSEPGEMKCFTIKYENKNPNTAQLLCAECGVLIDERYKTKMLSEENGAYWYKTNPSGIYPSFFISAFYSPLGFFSWREAVDMWLRSQMNFDKELLQVFINTVCGEGYSTEGRIVVSSEIRKRCEPFENVPSPVRFLTAAADIQLNRIEAEIVGWGLYEESWSIAYEIFTGDVEYNEVWQKLDKFLLRQWRHERGVDMIPIISMIDAGYKSRKVYTFCRLREHRQVFPIQGRAGWGKGLIERPAKERRNKYGVYLFGAYVDEIKSKFHSQLRLDFDREKEHNPGYCHFPLRQSHDEKYFNMLTAERLTTRKVRGFPVLEWELLKGRRNEALDARVYNIAALNVITPDFDVLQKTGNLLVAPQGSKKKKRRVLSTGVH